MKKKQLTRDILILYHLVKEDPSGPQELPTHLLDDLPLIARDSTTHNVDGHQNLHGYSQASNACFYHHSLPQLS